MVISEIPGMLLEWFPSTEQHVVRGRDYDAFNVVFQRREDFELFAEVSMSLRSTVTCSVERQDLGRDAESHQGVYTLDI